jgi:hypothetical protein
MYNDAGSMRVHCLITAPVAGEASSLPQLYRRMSDKAPMKLGIEANPLLPSSLRHPIPIEGNDC